MRCAGWRRLRRVPIFRSMKGLRRKQGGPELEARIATVLAQAAPLLRIEHCALEIASFDRMSGQLTLRMAGSCPDCSGSPAMFATALEAHVRLRVPEVQGVRVLD